MTYQLIAQGRHEYIPVGSPKTSMFLQALGN